jgi:hypothetical protein
MFASVVVIIKLWLKSAILTNDFLHGHQQYGEIFKNTAKNCVFFERNMDYSYEHLKHTFSMISRRSKIKSELFSQG